MRIATVAGRLQLWTSSGWIDVEQASGRFAADPHVIVAAEGTVIEL